MGIRGLNILRIEEDKQSRNVVHQNVSETLCQRTLQYRFLELLELLKVLCGRIIMAKEWTSRNIIMTCPDL
jgi:hypothetical protein